MILHLNVHCVNLCQKYRWFRDVINKAHLVFCDGDGVRWGARMLGLLAPPKITYDRWIWQLAELAEQNGYRLYFLGGGPGVAAAAAGDRRAIPNLQVAGTHSATLTSGRRKRGRRCGNQRGKAGRLGARFRHAAESAGCATIGRTSTPTSR